MKPSIETLGKILYSPSQYVIPVFQRNYRWERPQWEKLWDALEEIQAPEKRGNHFMGFLVFVPGLPQPGQNTTFHLIDGQQRLATISLLLAAIRNVARQRGLGDLADEIHQDYLTHPRKQGEEHYRVLPKERDHDSYVSVIEGRDGAAGRVAEAVRYFEERLADAEGDDPEVLRRWFNAARQRLEFMCATLETENAYNIFKSLNSIGVPLGASDLIRNFVFMHVQPEDHDAFDEELWTPLEERFLRDDRTLDDDRFSQFFRDFLMAATRRYIGPKDTFPAFDTHYEATEFNARALTRELHRWARWYDVIAGRQPDSNEAVTTALRGLNTLDSSTTYPLLLALFAREEAEADRTARLTDAVEMLQGFILRRFVCGESSRGYGQMLVRGIPSEDDDCVGAVERYLCQRGWPDDRQFEAAFVEFPLYQRGYTREVLATLEAARGHREPADLSGAQVEHIMPQTLSAAWRESLGEDAERIHADWQHRPGNLTLSAYNAELWNHEFSRKRERYAQSNVVLTREVANQRTWGELQIRERGIGLAREAAAIWRGPSETALGAVEPVEDSEEPERLDLRRRFWAGLVARLATEQPEVPRPYTRASPTIRIKSGIPQVGIDLQFNLKHKMIGIDVWFWRRASWPHWERLRERGDELNDWFGGVWSFETVEGQDRRRMSLSLSPIELRDESNWPRAQVWFCDKLAILYREVIPRLR